MQHSPMDAETTVIIDTDPGLDDALALILALRCRKLDIRAVTVVAGNVPLQACTANALRIIEAAGADPAPAVFPGCATPLSDPAARAEHVHGGDGLGGAAGKFPVRRLRAEATHAADRMVSLARELGPQLTLISLGPLTNVATALRKDAAAMSRVRRLVVMGGSADGRGNATPVAEFNFFSDPAAARAVVRSSLPVVLVGLNVTEQAILPRRRFRRRLGGMADGKLRRFLAACSEPYFDFCRKQEGNDGGCALHDPLAVAAAIQPDLLRTEPLACDVVDSPGLTRGMLLTGGRVQERPAQPIRVATAVDAARFVDLFLDIVCSG